MRLEEAKEKYCPIALLAAIDLPSVAKCRTSNCMLFETEYRGWDELDGPQEECRCLLGPKTGPCGPMGPMGMQGMPGEIVKRKFSLFDGILLTLFGISVVLTICQIAGLI